MIKFTVEKKSVTIKHSHELKKDDMGTLGVIIVIKGNVM